MHKGMLSVRCVVLFLLFSTVSHSLKFEDWHCGSEDMSRQLAYNLVQSDCPEYAGLLNHCCVIHDDCYVKQLGQPKCDEDFCMCNKRSLNNTALNGQTKKCQQHYEMICFVMPFLGGFAYQSSVNWTEPDDLVFHRPAEPFRKDYDVLYTQCPDMNSTLSSCSLNFEECSLSRPLHHCAVDFRECVEEAGLLSLTPSCLPQSRLMSVLISKEIPFPFIDFSDPRTFYMVKNGLLLVLSSLAFFFLFAAMYITYRNYYRRQNSSKGSLEDIKYSAVV